MGQTPLFQINDTKYKHYGCEQKVGETLVGQGMTDWHSFIEENMDHFTNLSFKS